MARIAKTEKLEPILTAAKQWIETCLVSDGSIFGLDSLWRPEVIEQLFPAFVDKPDTGEGTFIEKLEKQMAGASSEAQRLMSEMLWALLLFPSNVDADTKRAQVGRILKLSGAETPLNHELLADEVLRGIGSGGPGYNNYRWRELAFLIRLAQDLKKRLPKDRKEILSDYEAFWKWIEGVPKDGQRQFRHMIRYFAFPDRVERMSSNNDRISILVGFGVANRDEVKHWTDRHLDDALLDLRRRLEAEHPGEILDFYEEPLSSRWRDEGGSESSVRGVLTRYLEEQVVFYSADRGVRYAVSKMDDSGVEILRLDADQPHRLTFDRASKLVEKIGKAGAMPFSALDDTSAVRTTVLQATELGLSPDKKSILDLSDLKRREEVFVDVLNNLNMQRKAYKPAMLLCVLDGLDGGELRENRIAFDWIAPRFIERLRALGEEIGYDEAAQPFYHLTGDLFWMLAAKDLRNVMRDGGEGASAARRKVKYALLKDTYWALLQDPAARGRIRQTLESLIPAYPIPPMAPITDLLMRAKASFEAAGLRIQPLQLQRMVSALAAKPFLILTGLAGSGKTKLAQAFARWMTSETSGDPFYPGAKIDSDQTTYEVTASDKLSVVFRNVDGTRVMLPREMIGEWANHIRRAQLPRSTSARAIREQVKESNDKRFSSQLHSFETHLKAAAFAWLDSKTRVGGAPAYTIVAVGADWTGNENILGYPDGLNFERYVTRGALDLMLQAQCNPTKPHFLILDEMNLSHVERYFADFLSAVESGEPIRLHHDEIRNSYGRGIPDEVRIPSNLFVIGTVNVDETTYMFSPKVLDRANVIEFRMDDSELRAFLESPERPNFREVDGVGDRSGFADAFVNAAQTDTATVPASVRTLFQEEMRLFFNILQEHGAEFGYRVAHETARFLHFYGLLGGYAEDDQSWFAPAFDCVIVQKFLPKLHGSRPKLEGLLWALSWACGAPRDGVVQEAFVAECREAGRAQDELKFGPEAVLKKLGADAPRYPLSFDKVLRMWRKLVRDQFVAFAEA